jgi:catechol 2,3-dioxygenase-like lactoylglutathione lyase family enzyme
MLDEARESLAKAFEDYECKTRRPEAVTRRRSDHRALDGPIAKDFQAAEPGSFSVGVAVHFGEQLDGTHGTASVACTESKKGISLMKLNAVMVRYIVNDVDDAIAFYTKHLGFRVSAQSGPYFAILARENFQLVLSPPKGPGGGSQPTPDGRKPEPGGWNRIIVQSGNLEGDIEVLKKAGVEFRNDIVAGPGGRQILLEDPSGNPVELFQPAPDGAK